MGLLGIEENVDINSNKNLKNELYCTERLDLQRERSFRTDDR